VLKSFGSGEDGQRNDGVNIGVEAGAKVKAAAASEVVSAGDELVGFGNLVLIRHPGGWVSAYAHSDRMLVKEGELVAQGQAIAEAGDRQCIEPAGSLRTSQGQGAGRSGAPLAGPEGVDWAPPNRRPP
jgi:septal ring factor EnvC (AmiA/AmiB activator)